jgi:hypothetical protein
MPRHNAHITGKNHPKNQDCDTCDSPAGFWCLSKTGQEKVGWKNQHVSRLNKADDARGGRMIGGEFHPFQYIPRTEEK